MAIAACKGCGYVRSEWALWAQPADAGPCPSCGETMSWMGVIDAHRIGPSRG